MAKAQPRDLFGEAIYVAEVAAASYAISRLAGGGGPEGRKFLNQGIELWTGALIGGAGLLIVGRGNDSPGGISEKAEKAAGHMLALGAGCIAAYTSRLGFEAGLENAKPPADEAQANQNQVSGAPPQQQVICYYLPAPMISPPEAPQMQMIPSVVSVQPQPEPAAPVIVQEKRPVVPVTVEKQVVGADEIDSAVEILDRMNQR